MLPLLLVKGKAQVQREKEREKEKSKGEEGLQGRGVLHLLCAGPAGPIDDDRDGSTLGSYSPLVPFLDVISWSWHSIPSRWTVW